METRFLGMKDTIAQEVFVLLKDIYTTSDSMSELFDDKFPSIQSCSDYFSGIISKPGGIVIFAETEDRLAGYITINPRHQANLKHTADLNMGIKSGFRGQQIGSELLAKAFEQASLKKTIEIVYLMVRADNLPALKLYGNFGFEKIAILERDTKISGKYYDGVLMRRFLKTYL